MHISSLQNGRIKHIVKLGKRRYRDREGLMIIEGYRGINRALENNYKINELYICPDYFLGENEDALIASCEVQGASVFTLTEQVFRKIAYRDRPEGLLALAPQFKTSLDDIKLEENTMLVVGEAIEKLKILVDRLGDVQLLDGGLDRRHNEIGGMVSVDDELAGRAEACRKEEVARGRAFDVESEALQRREGSDQTELGCHLRRQVDDEFGHASELGGQGGWDIKPAGATEAESASTTATIHLQGGEIEAAEGEELDRVRNVEGSEGIVLDVEPLESDQIIREGELGKSILVEVEVFQAPQTFAQR